MKALKSIYIFYFLVGYIFIQFAWWGFHIMKLNEEITDLKIEFNDNIIETNEALLHKLKARKLMVAGEGAVFLILLLFGFYLMQKSFKKEVALSNQQKNFLMSVSHELKSPITSIKLNLQTLAKYDFEKEKNASIITTAIEDVDRLKRLVDNILLATQIENGNYPINNEEINLSKVLKEVSLLFQNICEDENDQLYRIIKFKIAEEILILSDEEALRSVFLNLIENAIKYSPKGSLVQINLLRIDRKVLCQVIDEGKGINTAHVGKIFNKFYRIENEGTRVTEGTGLGLFIVKFFVDALGGNIAINSNIHKGSIFEVSFDM